MQAAHQHHASKADIYPMLSSSWLQGDRLAVGRVMPKAKVGDFVVVADVGAYTLSMYSR
jgi:diaminopimelate decarboxylase